MDFDSFIKQAWADHADDAAGVALRLEQDGPALVSQAGQVARLVQLVHHVHGEHLARWQDGLALLARIAVLPVQHTPLMRTWNVVHLASRTLSPAAEALRYFMLEHGEALLAEHDRALLPP